MTKEIWVARDKNGNVWEFNYKPELCDGVFRSVRGDGTYVKTNTFNISLEPLQCVKVIVDTLNQSYRIMKVPDREDGYYAAISRDSQTTWILQSKDDVWHYYHGGKLGDTDGLKIGTMPIPRECLP